MKLASSLCVVLLLIGASSAKWVSVNLGSDRWVALKEIVPQQRYLLHPQALVTDFIITSGCDLSRPSSITVQLWDQQTLDEANSAIQSSNLCCGRGQQCNSNCRVEPYQVNSIDFKNVRGNTLTVKIPLIFVPLVLPKTIKFEVVRNDRRTRCSNLRTQDIGATLIGFTTKWTRSQQDTIALSLDTSRLKPLGKSRQSIPQKIQANPRQEISEKLKSDLASLRELLAAERQRSLTQCNMSQKPALSKSPSGRQVISDCLDVKLLSLPQGLYFLESEAREVLCTASGEMVVLRRTKHDVSFDQGWAMYRKGFGNPAKGDFFSGLDFISRYTAPSPRCMRLVLTPVMKDQPARMGEYSNFLIGPENTNFKLSYKYFNGTLTTDPLKNHNHEVFVTSDHPPRDFCARGFSSGNWFSPYKGTLKSCCDINLFGKKNSGFSSSGLNSKMVDNKMLLNSAFMTLRKPGNDPTRLRTIMTLTNDRRCPATPQVQMMIIDESAEYLIILGGAAGGSSPHLNSYSGGRGAVVKVRVFLKAYTRLRVLVGCPGGIGHASGEGGDGTFVAIANKYQLLAAAGGGGGAGWTNGGDGRSESSGGSAILRPGAQNSSILFTTGKSWNEIEDIVMGQVYYPPTQLIHAPQGMIKTGGLTKTDGKSYSYAAGGGGGFEAGKGAEEPELTGGQERPKQSAGGGGGSACGDGVLSCDIAAGGNKLRYGFVTLSMYPCF